MKSMNCCRQIGKITSPINHHPRTRLTNTFLNAFPFFCRGVLRRDITFKNGKFKPGKWHPSEQIDDNTSTFPCYEYSSLVSKFANALYDKGLIYPFDWGGWNYGVKLSRNPELIQKANLLTLRKLITAHVRQDRFCEGHLVNVFESGLIVKILERLRKLKNSNIEGASFLER